MKDKIKKYLKEAVFLGLAVILISNALSYYRSMDLNKNNLEINSFNLINNTKYNVVNDKPILLHFWATWCPTCKFEASNIEKLSKDYEVITVAVQSGSNIKIQKYLDEHNLSFNVVNDIDGTYSKKFNIKAFPTSLIYDKDKKLKFTDVGYSTTISLYSKMKLSK